MTQEASSSQVSESPFSSDNPKEHRLRDKTGLLQLYQYQLWTGGISAYQGVLQFPLL